MSPSPLSLNLRFTPHILNQPLLLISWYLSYTCVITMEMKISLLHIQQPRICPQIIPEHSFPNSSRRLSFHKAQRFTQGMVRAGYGLPWKLTFIIGKNSDLGHCPGEDKCKSSKAKDYGCSLGSWAEDWRSCAPGLWKAWFCGEEMYPRAKLLSNYFFWFYLFK